MNKGVFKSGPSPYHKGGYVVATEDGSQIICILQPADYETDEKMIEVAKYIESHVSYLLNRQDIPNI